MKNEEKIILIIEDDADLNELMADKVVESGFKSKSIMTGNEAIIWLKINSPLFMFLDFSLPDYTGKEFIHELEAQDIKVPPFVVATGRGDEMVAVEMMKLGARDYIVKNTVFLDMIGVIIKQLCKEIENENKLIQIESELNESNEFSKQIIEGVKEGIVVYDKQLNYLVWNPFMEQLTGYKSIDIIGKNINNLLPNLDKKRLTESIRLVLENKVSEKTEFEFYFDFPETGKSDWVSEEICPMKNSKGEIIAAISTIRNITMRKKAEENLISSKAAIQNLIYSSTELIESTGSKIDYLKFMEKVREISGAKYAVFNLFEPDGLSFKTLGFSGLSNFMKISEKLLDFDFINKTWKNDSARLAKIKDKTITEFKSLSDLTNHAIPEKVTHLIEKVFKLGETFVVKISKNNIQIGDFTLLFEKGETIQNPELVELFANQVGLYIERQKAEEKLKKNEKKFRIIFAENPQPMWIYNLQTLNILEVNDAALRHYGYTRDEFLALSVVQIHPESFIPEFMQLIDKRRMGINTNSISQHVKKNGEVIFVEVQSNHVSSFGENARLIMANDITKRKIAEDKLISSFSLLHATIESTTDGIMVVDINNKISVFNSKFLEIWKIKDSIFNKETNNDIMQLASLQTSSPEEFISSTKKIYSNPETTSKDIIKLIDGKVYERNSVPQYIDNKIVGRVWSMRDITERILAENAIQAKVEDMTRLHKLTVGRELVMIELKKEINNLLEKTGQQTKYAIME